VSLKNAKKGAGSSFQQGGTFVFDNAKENQPTLAWREDYPGDWIPLADILRDGANIQNEDMPKIEWSKVLDFVIECRKDNEKKDLSKTTTEGASNHKGDKHECGELACDLNHLKKGTKEK